MDVDKGKRGTKARVAYEDLKMMLRSRLEGEIMEVGVSAEGEGCVCDFCDLNDTPKGAIRREN